MSGVGINAVSMVIMNRWGQTLYSSNSKNTGWNGKTSSGTDCTDGTYYYIIDVTTTVDTQNYKGFLTLIR